MRRHVFNFAPLLATLAMLGAAPTTQPAPDVDALGVQVGRLVDRDPRVRAAARDALMHLSRDQLPVLREVVARLAAPNHVIETIRRAALREIVMHVFLTGEHDFAGSGQSMIGFTMRGEADRPPTVISCRMGFDGYRALEDGDVIVGITLPGGPTANVRMPINNPIDLKSRLSPSHVGDEVVLQVVRRGEPVNVTVRLAPAVIPDVDPARGFDSRESIPEPHLDRAIDYWTRQFLPALSPVANDVDAVVP